LIKEIRKVDKELKISGLDSNEAKNIFNERIVFLPLQ